MLVRDKLKLIRKKLGISQSGLSKKLKISRGYVGELECGIKQPSKFLRKKINYLFRKHCVISCKFSHVKREPLVEVMVPQKPKVSLFRRILNKLLGKR